MSPEGEASTSSATVPSGWYYAHGDPLGTKRYWDGTLWIGEPQAVTGAKAATSPAGDLASIRSRLGARAIDLVLLGLVLAPVMIALVLPFIDFQVISESLEAGVDPPDSALPGAGTRVMLGLAVTVLSFLWETLWTAKAGGTPGKLMLGIRVAEASSMTTPPSTEVAAKRAANNLIGLASLVAALVVFVWLATIIIGIVSLILIFSDDRRQSVMDKIAGTVVIKK